MSPRAPARPLLRALRPLSRFLERLRPPGTRAQVPRQLQYPQPQSLELSLWN